MPGIGIEGVTRRFGNVAAVDHVDLAIGKGEFVTLLGPSGCGKTTTLRMVAGLEHNDGGRISIGERVVSDAARRLFVPPDHRNIGMVFQSYAIWPHMTVFDNVAYPLHIRRRPAAEVKAKVEWALQLVEMGAFADRPAPQLSGGQQQRVAIARALVFEPEVLLLDEPLSNLDAKLRVQTGDEFRRLQRRLGITTLYVTHDQEEAMALSDRVVVMHAGRILQEGAPEEIYRRPANKAVAAFFGSPNLLEGEVLSAAQENGGACRLAVRGVGWEGTCRGRGTFASGERVLVMIRPEDIQLDAESQNARSPDREIAWQGHVAETIFRGARRWVAIDVAGRRFNVEAPSAQAVATGQPVTLRAAADQAWAIRPDEPARA